MKTCSKCNITKPTTSFCKNKRSKDGLNTCCRTCASINSANHYKKSRLVIFGPFIPEGWKQCIHCFEIKLINDFKKYHGTRLNQCKVCCNNKQLEINRSSKQIIVDYLGGKCIICGYNKCNDALVPHHINKKEKEHNLSHIATKKWEVVKKELDKCVLLCVNCHTIEHIGELPPNKGQQGNNCVQRKCPKHGMSTFGVTKRKDRNSYKYTCRKCAAERKRNKKDINKEELFKLLGSICLRCGNDDIRTINYHHLNHLEKEHAVSQITSYSTDKMLREAKKCIAICGNCHVEIHHNK